MTFERWAQAEQAMFSLNGQTVIEGATTPMVVKFADAKVMDPSLGPAGQKRQFGVMDGQFGAGGPGTNKRQFGAAGAAAGPMGMAGMAAAGYNPYAAAAAMGYDMSTMAAMGYGNIGMMAGMAGMQVRSGGRRGTGSTGGRGHARSGDWARPTGRQTR